MKALLALIPIVLALLMLFGKYRFAIHGGLILHKVYRHFNKTKREDERI